MLKEIGQLQEALREARTVYESDSIWKVKHDLLFTHKGNVVEPLLETLGLELKCYYPDTSHQDDVVAYYDALKSLVKGLPGWEDDDDGR